MLACAFAPVYGQYSDTLRIQTKYTKFLVPSTFKDNFSLKEDLKDFKKLRKYYFEQAEKIDQLNLLLSTSYSKNELNDTTKFQLALKDIGKWLKKANGNETVSVRSDQYERYLYYHSHDESYFWDRIYDAPDNDTTVEVSMLIDLQDDLRRDLGNLSEKRNEFGRLVSNIAILDQDLRTCERAIDEALRPESEDQSFRTKMSIVFAALIGFLLAVFFLMICIRGDKGIAKNLLSELGLQFITLFVLIIAIILFGILDILKGSELAAILAGISGYILGSKTNVAAANPAPNPAPNEGK